MTADARSQTIVGDLDTALRDVLGVRRVDDLARFADPKDGVARYLARPRLRIDAHFNLEPAFLIFDPTLGTLGLVELVLAEPGAPPDAYAASVRKCIDEATYLRHLLLRDQKLDGNRALTVELVLLTTDETAGDHGRVATIGETLRDLLRQTDSLTHVGINVLCHGGASVGFAGRLRRAFPWLLKATRLWLESKGAESVIAVEPQPGAQTAQAAPPVVPAPANGNGARARLERLVMTNYRLPGVRELILNDARVHLIHGPNGSGKSSIAEALELMSSGKVDRIEKANERAYDRVIWNRTTKEAATIKLQWRADANGRAPDSVLGTVTQTGLDVPLDGKVHASSFRLDQALMDRLVAYVPHERARVFLQAFFPEAGPSLVEYETTAKRFQTTRDPIQRRTKQLSEARAALKELESWRGGTSTPTTEDHHDLLNRWLELTALVDLAQRERSLRLAIQAGRSAGWQPGNPVSTALAAALGADPNLAELETQERNGTDALGDLYSKLSSFTPPADQPTTAGSMRVSATQAEALNAACLWLFDSVQVKTNGLFGDRLVQVINRAHPGGNYASVTIGGDKWAESLLHDLDGMLAACNALTTDTDAPEWPGKGPCAEYDEAKTAQHAMLAAGKVLTERFVDKLRPPAASPSEFDGSVIAAINELMALFTPARWGYTDIQLPPRIEAGSLGLALEIGERDAVRADLHLNTAELNLFTLTLFLLCAPRVRAPLNLLVFDDPLQNMDELTTTSVARGLAKLVRLCNLLKREVDLLLLFHAADDLDRFRDEIAAASYQLPWLSPGTAPIANPIQVEPPRGNIYSVQSLQGMLEFRK